MLTPKEVIAKARVDFMGEAGKTVASLVIAALDKAGYKIVRKNETEQMLQRVDDDDTWTEDNN